MIENENEIVRNDEEKSQDPSLKTNASGPSDTIPENSISETDAEQANRDSLEEAESMERTEDTNIPISADYATQTEDLEPETEALIESKMAFEIESEVESKPQIEVEEPEFQKVDASEELPKVVEPEAVTISQAPELTQEVEVDSVSETEIVAQENELVAPIQSEISNQAEDEAQIPLEEVFLAPPVHAEKVYSTSLLSDTLPSLEMEEGDEDEEDEHLDYSKYSKDDLLKRAEDFYKSEDVLLAYRTLNKIKPFFDEIHETERNAAFQKFIDAGGEATDFEFKSHDKQSLRFEEIYKQIRERRKQAIGNQEKQKQQNLGAKLNVLARLRSLTEDVSGANKLNEFKELQNEWKSIGAVGPEKAQNLYASYRHLVDTFFSNRNIYFELRDFDRQKNLTAKLELISRVEKLLESPLILKAAREVVNIQDEFRHIGPVTKEKQDELWTKFKELCDKVFEKRNQFLEERKKGAQEEAERKAVLVERAKLFAEYSSSKAIDWINTTKEVIALLEDWKSVGFSFRNETEALSHEFWQAYKRFFIRKNEFFAGLDAERKKNLATKIALCEKAEALQDSEDWDYAAEQLKQLQVEWKETPPVSGKEREAIWERFRKAMDTFFEKKRDHRKVVDKEYLENLALKNLVCERIEKMAEAGTGTMDDVDAFKAEFQGIGYVPSKEVGKVMARFYKAIDALMEKSKVIPAKEKSGLRMSFNVQVSKVNPEAKKNLQKQEGYIQKRINQLNHDIDLWRNNLEFFAKSKNADAVREEFNKKIKLAELEIKELKAQQKLLENKEE